MLTHCNMVQYKKKTDVAKPEFYPSNGNILVNATTGQPYPFPKGSEQEQRLFKVSFVNGKLNNKGFMLPAGQIYKEQPVQAYFNGPSEYERYFDLDLAPEVHSKWKSRQPQKDPLPQTAS